MTREKNRIKVDDFFISRFEEALDKKGVTISKDEVDDICNFLKISKDWLLSGEGGMNDYVQIANNLLNIYILKMLI